MQYYASKPRPIDRLRSKPAHELLQEAQNIPFDYENAKLACAQLGISVPKGDHTSIQEIFGKVSRQANTHRDFLATYISLCKQQR